ncbi:MAG: CinA family protein [Rickettsiales bacterium]|nr:MAG: CinA family protein [Rickettsiales bacterium]
MSNRMEHAATELLNELKDKSINIITVESATGGKIISSLVDIPFYGSYIYGSIVTYDTDAKRFIVKVKHADIYTDITAKQMAIGALENSRAFSALSITGYAAPAPIDRLEKLGTVDVAFAIRTKTDLTTGDHNYSVFNRNFNFCKDDVDDHIIKLCLEYKEQATEFGMVDSELVKTLRNVLREEMAIGSMKFATSKLQDLLCISIDQNDIINYLDIDKVCTTSYDQSYVGEPSYIIGNNIDYTNQCELN